MDLINEVLHFYFYFIFSESIDQYRKQIFILLFQRLQNSKTTKYIKSKLLSVSLWCGESLKEGGLVCIDSENPSVSS